MAVCQTEIKMISIHCYNKDAAVPSRGTGDAGGKAERCEWKYLLDLCIQQGQMQEMSIKGKQPCREREIKRTQLQCDTGK